MPIVLCTYTIIVILPLDSIVFRLLKQLAVELRGATLGCPMTTKSAFVTSVLWPRRF